jgi:chemotaxis protein methyltransferase CheR
VLAAAMAGLYPVERVRSLSIERLKRVFQRGTGAQNGLLRVRPELCKMVTFKTLNLLEKRCQIGGPFDAVFCRNVMIYFHEPTRRKIQSRFPAVG